MNVGSFQRAPEKGKASLKTTAEHFVCNNHISLQFNSRRVKINFFFAHTHKFSLYDIRKLKASSIKAQSICAVDGSSVGLHKTYKERELYSGLKKYK